MRIAILYVCTGRYLLFWKNFFSTCEQHFARHHNKEYFVFTDQDFSPGGNPRVHHIYQPPLSWPHVTLKRYHMFARIKETLKNFDSIFFFNANVLFCREITDDWLPSLKHPLVFQQHPGFYNKSPRYFPLEHNVASQAYVKPGHSKVYFAGGINGGLRDAYLSMVDAIARAVDIDEENGIIAKWHDESHLNKYAIGKSCKLWHPGFAVPDGRNMPFPRMIRLVDKRSVGGHDFMRGINEEKKKSFSERFLFRPSFPSTPQRGERPIILARLLGGLGNQMFIYAAAYALAKRLNSELNIDSGALQSDKTRRYELYRFGLMDPQWRIPKGGDWFLGMVCSLRASWGMSSHWSYFKSAPVFSPCLENASGNCYLTGYWQSARYFRGYEEEIRKLYVAPMSNTPSVIDLKKYILSSPTVAVHLRRGDYTSARNLAKHGILPIEYYDCARRYVEKIVPGCKYVVFSDEPEVATEFFGHWDRCQIAPRHDQIDDLMLMKACKHAIIANSSFSWWGAWLGCTQGQVVVAPRHWFSAGIDLPNDVSSLIPHSWVTL